MRPAHNEASLRTGFNAARAEAEACFGNPAVYIEKFIVDPHHIEFQIIADSHGNVIHLGERDCSLQRRNQKIIEETPLPFPAMDTGLREAMGEAAVKICREIGYENCGTIEFLVDDAGQLLFHGDEHPHPGGTSHHRRAPGCDLIKEQIRIAAGQRCPPT